jgi:hypothetical protein
MFAALVMERSTWMHQLRCINCVANDNCVTRDRKSEIFSSAVYALRQLTKVNDKAPRDSDYK